MSQVDCQLRELDGGHDSVAVDEAIVLLEDWQAFHGESKLDMVCELQKLLPEFPSTQLPQSWHSIAHCVLLGVTQSSTIIVVISRGSEVQL